MGSQQSAETMPQHPVIKKIAKCLYLHPVQQNLTFSLAHRHFANEFSRTQKTKFDRSMNPFCPVKLVDTDKWINCCFISPLMAVADVSEVVGKSRRLEKKCEVLAVYKRMEVRVQVEEVLELQGNLGLLVFGEPYWRVGWAGVSYVSEQEELYKLDLKIVHHPSKAFDKEQNKQFFIQQVRRLKLPKVNALSATFTIQMAGPQGSIICKLVDKKPYVIGIQISPTEIKFIDAKLFRSMQEKCKEYIKKQGQRDILKSMDINQLEIQLEL